MNAGASKILKANPNVSEGRRDLLRFLGGGGVLLVANGCALESAEGEDEEVGSIKQLAAAGVEGINLAYRAAFNRWPTQIERDYWLRTGLNMSKMITHLRRWMRTTDGAVDRVRVIRDSYQAVYGRIFGSGEYIYWNNYLSNNDAMFCEVCKWLESYGRDGGFAHTGWYKIKHAYDSVWQSDTSIEDYSGKTYNVPAS